MLLYLYIFTYIHTVITADSPSLASPCFNKCIYILTKEKNKFI